MLCPQYQASKQVKLKYRSLCRQIVTVSGLLLVTYMFFCAKPCWDANISYSDYITALVPRTLWSVIRLTYVVLTRLPRYCGHLYSHVQLYMYPLNLTYVVPTRWPRSPSLCGLQGPTHPLTQTHSVAEYHNINDIYIKYVQVPLVSKNLQYYLLLQTAGWSKTRKISNDL